MLNTLNVAQTGLHASQTQVENVMNNLANENTPGYKKRVVNISEIDHADARMTGRGVFVDNASRITNVYMYQNLIREEAKANSLSELNSILGDMESLFKETDTSGLSADLNRYFKSIENLRTNPTSEVYKNDIINNATSLVNDLNELYRGIEEKEKDYLAQTRKQVDKINEILQNIGDISKKIQDTNPNTIPNDLLDKRDSLEKELAQYVDVEISREDSYELKIAGVTAVRFDTNVHQVKLIEEYKPQHDSYTVRNNDVSTTQIIGADTTGDGIIDLRNPVDVNGDGTIDSLDYPGGKVVSDYVNSFPTFTGLAAVPEVQLVDISGTVDASGTVDFLGTTITPGGATAADVVAEILVPATNASIISAWNTNNPDKQIATITAGAGDQIRITYQQFEGDVPALPNAASSGINFTGSLEDLAAVNDGKGFAESVTYVLNNKHSITVTIGEVIVDAAGNPVDFDQSGAPIGEVTQNNVLQALVYQINQNKDIGGTVTAYNGKYELDKNGNKILTDDARHSKYVNPTLTGNALTDRYLYIESNIDGEDGNYLGEVFTNQNTPIVSVPPKPDTDPYSVTKQQLGENDALSEKGIDDIHLEIFDDEVKLSAGSLKPLIDNIKTDSGNNRLNDYKARLDNFAKELVNMTSSYIENSNGTYIYGEDDIRTNNDEDKKVQIGLFSGGTVKTLEFNRNVISTFTQEKLDYLADLQWKENVDFDGTGENTNSFSEYFQVLRVNIADDRENVIFDEKAQEAVTESIKSSYEQYTKVDKDEQMVNLIKFQSAYEANAKVITVIDEMLSTLLNIKR